MRGVRRDVREERFPRPVADPADGLVKVNVGAVPGVALLLPVMEEDRIEVVRAGRIRWLPDASSLVQHGLLKSLVHRSLWEVVAEMPLAEDTRPIPGRLQHLCDGRLVGMHHGPSEIGVHYPRAVVVPARHERGARRSADW